MDTAETRTLHYQRSHFVTHLPVACRYSPSHAWLAMQADGVWRVGLTKFATRMLGETVDHGFTVQPGDRVQPGQIIGWIEGFKAISDVFCVAEGEFLRGNPALRGKIDLIHRDPHGEGWLYEVKGQPDAKCVDVEGYRDLLDKTIDRLLARQKGDTGA